MDYVRDEIWKYLCNSSDKVFIADIDFTITPQRDYDVEVVYYMNLTMIMKCNLNNKYWSDKRFILKDYPIFGFKKWSDADKFAGNFYFNELSTKDYIKNNLNLFKN